MQRGMAAKSIQEWDKGERYSVLHLAVEETYGLAHHPEPQMATRITSPDMSS
jgi:hypothetical protein